ncbi:SMI1/KNR4 family protein [Polyangium mundeleinium]|uniref:SMI1/KNR4 family protein n=1 Tax=Polyangium mundeleinium TaxID=2995306 RepID=A0ABT5EIL9_9BACT|nr:SMI1/KNR4 family protein [Polyangium mundeleinium]MDC0740606.1 SMI1/KNR4 family protein [Polyangium mundeleinium]
MTPEELLAEAFERVKAWMANHGAELLVQNLAPGASAERLRDAEAELGFSLGCELRALWSLHDGQHEEMNGFVEAFDLLTIEGALSGRDSVMYALAFLRENPRTVPESGLTQDELFSDAWLPFAGRDADGLVVNTVSGRVFEILHDDSPPLRMHAASLVAWATEYASRVVADDYRVEEGFGDYYLELRDREAERRHEERSRFEREERQRKAKMSVKELLEEAVSRNREDAAQEVLERAEQTSQAALAEAVALLFATGASPAFLAGTLRPMLNRLTLSAAEWKIVAEGGARMGNDAIRDIALARSRTAASS